MLIISETRRQLVLLAVMSVIGVALLPGCGSLDRKPQNIEESLYVAASYGTALARSVNAAYSAGSITKDQQLDALDTLEEARYALQAGQDAYRVSNMAAARSRLDQAESALRVVALLLSTYRPEEG